MDEKNLKLQIELAGRRGKNRRASRMPRPSALERKMLKIIDEFLSAYNEDVKNFVIPQLLFSESEAALEKARMDSWVDDLLSALNLSLDKVSQREKKLAQDFQELSEEVGLFNQKSFKRTVNATLGVNVVLNEPWLSNELKSWAAQNVELVSSIPSQQHGQISRLSLEGVRSGKNVREIQSEIEKQFNLPNGRAKTIARTETAKLNSELTKTRQKDLGINFYYWATSRDERVRDSDAEFNHAILDGKLCDYDDPTIYSDDGGATWKARSSIGAVELHPGEDFNCRCSAELATDLLLEKLGI